MRKRWGSSCAAAGGAERIGNSLIDDEALFNKAVPLHVSPASWPVTLPIGQTHFQGLKHVAAVLQQQGSNLGEAGQGGFIGVVLAGAVQAGHEVFDDGNPLYGAGVEVGEWGIGVDEEDGFGVLGKWGVVGHLKVRPYVM